MNFVLAGWPTRRQYCRASLKDASTASEPPEEKKARTIPSGSVSRHRSSASSTEGMFVVPPNSV